MKRCETLTTIARKLKLSLGRNKEEVREDKEIRRSQWHICWISSPSRTDCNLIQYCLRRCDCVFVVVFTSIYSNMIWIFIVAYKTSKMDFFSSHCLCFLSVVMFVFFCICFYFLKSPCSIIVCVPCILCHLLQH